MPNPNAIDVPNLGFSEEQSAVLHIMINRSDKDYSTVDEILNSFVDNGVAVKVGKGTYMLIDKESRSDVCNDMAGLRCEPE